MADHLPTDYDDTQLDEQLEHEVVDADIPADEPSDEPSDEDQADGQPEDEESDDTAPDGSASTGTARAKRAQNARLARRSISKYLELTAAPAEHLSMLAAATGSKADPLDLAVAITTGPRVNLGAVDHLVSLSELVVDDPLEAMFAALGLEREQSKQAWALLSAAGAATGPLPGKDRDAAKAITRAVAELSKPELATFDAVRALARK